VDWNIQLCCRKGTVMLCRKSICLISYIFHAAVLSTSHFQHVQSSSVLRPLVGFSFLHCTILIFIIHFCYMFWPWIVAIFRKLSDDSCLLSTWNAVLPIGPSSRSVLPNIKQSQTSWLLSRADLPNLPCYQTFWLSEVPLIHITSENRDCTVFKIKIGRFLANFM
jgi:hypothetical protein